MERYDPWNFNLPDFSELGLADSWEFGLADCWTFGLADSSAGSSSNENLTVQPYLEPNVQDENNQQDQAPTPGPPEGPSVYAPGEKPTEGSMPTPPRPPRKLKSRTLRQEDWAPFKDRVLQLLKDSSLNEVRRTILTESGFDAT